MIKYTIAAIASIATIALLVSFTPISQQIRIQAQQSSTVITNDQGFAGIKVVQDTDHIVITVTKNGAATEGPIVVIPPKEGEGNNGTILTPGENVTAGKPGEGNVTIISPTGNITEVPNGNITQIDNSTVVVTEPNRTVTETPANVTVIDPPKTECGCGNQGTVQSNTTQTNTTEIPGQLPVTNTTQTNTTQTFPAGTTPTENQSNRGGFGQNNTGTNSTGNENQTKPMSFMMIYPVFGKT